MVLIFILSAPNISRADNACWDERENRGIIKSISRLFIVELTDGRQIALANIEFSAQTDHLKLKKWLAGKDVYFRSSGRKKDRHNRYIAQVFINRAANKLWLQRRFVENGEALVSALPTVRDCFKTLLQFEQTARAQARGLWRKAQGFKIYQATETEKLNHMQQGSYHIIEGRINDIGHSRNTLYLNFEKNWSTDFTVLIDKRLLKQGRKIGLSPESLKGKKIRVRGWLDHWRGPMIRLETIEMLEILNEDQ